MEEKEIKTSEIHTCEEYVLALLKDTEEKLKQAQEVIKNNDKIIEAMNAQFMNQQKSIQMVIKALKESIAIEPSAGYVYCTAMISDKNVREALLRVFPAAVDKDTNDKILLALNNALGRTAQEEPKPAPEEPKQKSQDLGGGLMAEEVSGTYSEIPDETVPQKPKKMIPKSPNIGKKKTIPMKKKD